MADTLVWTLAGLSALSVLALAVLLTLAAQGRGLKSRLFDIALVGTGVAIVLVVVLFLAWGQPVTGVP